MYEPSDPRELCDGAWHSIVVTKRDIEGSLTVDDNTPVYNSCYRVLTFLIF